MPPTTFTRKPEEAKPSVPSPPKLAAPTATGAPAGAPLFLRGPGEEASGAAPAVIQRQGDQTAARKRRFLGVYDNQLDPLSKLLAKGLHLANPDIGEQKSRDTKGRKIRTEGWEDAEGNTAWYRIHEGPELFAVKEADAAGDRVAQLIGRLGNDVSRLTELRNSGQGDSPEYTRVLDHALETEAAIWKEIRAAEEATARWRSEVEGDAELEQELDGKLSRLQGLAGSMPSLEDMVDDLAANRESPQPPEKKGGEDEAPTE